MNTRALCNGGCLELPVCEFCLLLDFAEIKTNQGIRHT